MNNKRKVFCAVLVIVGLSNLFAGLCWQMGLRFAHIDMTDLRLIVEYPVPTIQMFIGAVMTVAGKALF